MLNSNRLSSAQGAFNRGALEGTAGLIFYNLAYDLQQNVYVGSNSLAKWEELLNNQTSATSFFLPLALMGLANCVFSMAEVSCLNQEDKKGEVFFRMMRYAVPLVIGVFGLVNEIAQVAMGDPRIDNHGMDMMMSTLAVLVVVGGNLVYDKRNETQSRKVLGFLDINYRDY
ncbi:MAG: hypothetical protein G01um101416_1200 [Microgenomates group bacterium Gr01-1014_16]|nr:MAG: hypothetical protein G01um101416_1200 [Microgenomates group bacterium Gr01-1014_16]